MYAEIRIEEKKVEADVVASSSPRQVQSTPSICGCVIYARSLGAKLPIGYDAISYANWYKILPKSPPVIGGVAIFSYGEGIEKKHIAYISGFEESGIRVKEEIAIKGECVRRERVVSFTDRSLIGFLDLRTAAP